MKPMSFFKKAELLACASAIGWALPAHAELPAGYAIFEPSIKIEGSFVKASIEAKTPTSCAQAWTVFTDYDKFPSFLPGIEASRVTSQSADGLRVGLHQAGVANFGFFHKRYASDRDLTLRPPQSIQSESRPTDEAKISSSTIFVEQASTCLIRYDSDVEIPSWAPNFMASGFAKKMAKKQMLAMLGEISRRTPITTNSSPLQQSE